MAKRPWMVGKAITVLSREPDPDTLLFPVHVDGGTERWSLDRIRDAVADGAYLKEAA